MAGSPTVLVSRHHGADAARGSFEDDIARRLAESGHTVLVVPHLYNLPHGSDLWREVSALAGPLVVAGWISPRALQCLLRENAGAEPLAAVDLATAESAEAVCEAIEAALGPPQGEGAVREMDLPVTPRWYPIIDRSRCTACRHCLQFCLFGVYAMQADDVVAAQPDNCKDGCPACARVCPQGAIIFPLSDEPAIAGAPDTIMQPDAAARRMYYVRTGHLCPACGQVAEAGAQATAGASICVECGGPLGEPQAAEPSVVHEEIDALIDALDEMVAGGESE